MTHLYGPVPLDDPVYAEREFETKLAKDIQAGHWVLLLGPRQHGKTSALIRLRKNLIEAGMAVALVDLQAAPPFATFDEMVRWFADKVALAFDVPPPDALTSDLQLALEHALPEGNSNLLILIDEASNIDNQQWRNSFFGQIRAISSERATAAEGHMAKRLRFAFSGTFRPEQLVAEANSPFNVCERIETTDLSLENVKSLVAEAGLTEVDRVSEAIFENVAGQPYLAQRLIQAAQGNDDELAAVAAAVDELKIGTSDHITNLFSRVLAEPALVSMIAEVLRVGAVAVNAGDHDQRYLTVLGILKMEGRSLIFRNSLYADVAANTAGLASNVDQASPRRVVLFELPIERFTGMAKAELKEIAHSAQVGAVASYHAGSNRMALAGFGAATETLLLDFLSRQPQADLATAAVECQNTRSRHYDAGNPGSWTFADMMRGARKLTSIGDIPIPEPLREWRNLIHPEVALNNYKSDEDLSPEVCTAFGLFDTLLRDLP